MNARTAIKNSTARWAAIALVIAAALYAAWHWSGWRYRAQLATGWGARISCSCRYIEDRDMKSCKADFRRQEGMWMVRFSDDPENRAVHASVPFLAARKATYRPGFGCMPDAI